MHSSKLPVSLLDLGSGVGRLTPALATSFGGPVTGVEPSEKMRAHAEADAAHPDVTYLPGSAESIPMETSSCDAAAMRSGAGGTAACGARRQAA